MLNLKRHHVLYVLLVLALIVGIIFVLYPKPPAVSLIAVPTSTSTPVAATTTNTTTTTTTTPAEVPPKDAVTPMQFDVVTTPALQARGLGGRADVPENYGMLFVFDTPGKYGFWMKDMLTPIDMIWLSEDGTILKIDANVQPDTYPEAFYPPQPVSYVLETRANEASRRGWVVGTRIPLPSPYGA